MGHTKKNKLFEKKSTFFERNIWKSGETVKGGNTFQGNLKLFFVQLKRNSFHQRKQSKTVQLCFKIATPMCVAFKDLSYFNFLKRDRTLLINTPGVNFINILRPLFLYESILGSFSLVTVWLWNFLAKKYWRKSCS